MSRESADSVDIIEFLKTTRTLAVQVNILEDLCVPDEQKKLTREALKTLVSTACKYIDAGSIKK
jgi:hypothetical protein